jgi:NAD+ kinase
MKIGVIYKKEDQIIAGTAEQVIKELKKNGHKVNLAQAELVITLGGDGTILRAARLLAKTATPILGIHMGGLGFLTEIDLSELTEALEKIRQKKYKYDERHMIEALVGGRKVQALNDIVITKSGIARVIKMEIKGIAEYISDGIIFSSATGSTAYNLSAGGPILSPDSPSLIITAICPHSIRNRPIVLNKPIRLALIRGKEVSLTADGQEMVPLHEGQKIVIQKSDLKARFIRLGEYDFFGRVRDAFGFGPER